MDRQYISGMECHRINDVEVSSFMDKSSEQESKDHNKNSNRSGQVKDQLHPNRKNEGSVSTHNTNCLKLKINSEYSTKIKGKICKREVPNIENNKRKSFYEIMKTIREKSEQNSIENKNKSKTNSTNTHTVPEEANSQNHENKNIDCLITNFSEIFNKNDAKATNIQNSNSTQTFLNQNLSENKESEKICDKNVVINLENEEIVAIKNLNTSASYLRIIELADKKKKEKEDELNNKFFAILQNFSIKYNLINSKQLIQKERQIITEKLKSPFEKKSSLTRSASLSNLKKHEACKKRPRALSIAEITCKNTNTKTSQALPVNIEEILSKPVEMVNYIDFMKSKKDNQVLLEKDNADVPNLHRIETKSNVCSSTDQYSKVFNDIPEVSTESTISKLPESNVRLETIFHSKTGSRSEKKSNSVDQYEEESKKPEKNIKMLESKNNQVLLEKDNADVLNLHRIETKSNVCSSTDQYSKVFNDIPEVSTESTISKLPESNVRLETIFHSNTKSRSKRSNSVDQYEKKTKKPEKKIKMLESKNNQVLLEKNNADVPNLHRIETKSNVCSSTDQYSKVFNDISEVSTESTISKLPKSNIRLETIFHSKTGSRSEKRSNSVDQYEKESKKPEKKIKMLKSKNNQVLLEKDNADVPNLHRIETKSNVCSSTDQYSKVFNDIPEVSTESTLSKLPESNVRLESIFHSNSESRSKRSNSVDQYEKESKKPEKKIKMLESKNNQVLLEKDNADVPNLHRIEIKSNVCSSTDQYSKVFNDISEVSTKSTISKLPESNVRVESIFHSNTESRSKRSNSVDQYEKESKKPEKKIKMLESKNNQVLLEKDNADVPNLHRIETKSNVCSSTDQYSKVFTDIAEVPTESTISKLPESNVRLETIFYSKTGSRSKKRSNSVDQYEKESKKPEKKIKMLESNQNTILKVAEFDGISTKTSESLIPINLVQDKNAFLESNTVNQLVKDQSTAKSNLKLTNNNADTSKLNTVDFLNLINQSISIKSKKRSRYQVFMDMPEQEVPEKKFKTMDENTKLNLTEFDVKIGNNKANILSVNTIESLNLKNAVSKNRSKKEVENQNKILNLSEFDAKFRNNKVNILKVKKVDFLNQLSLINLNQHKNANKVSGLQKRLSGANQNQKVPEVPEKKMKMSEKDQNKIQKILKFGMKFTNNKVCKPKLNTNESIQMIQENYAFSDSSSCSSPAENESCCANQYSIVSKIDLPELEEMKTLEEDTIMKPPESVLHINESTSINLIQHEDICCLPKSIDEHQKVFHVPNLEVPEKKLRKPEDQNTILKLPDSDVKLRNNSAYNPKLKKINLAQHKNVFLKTITKGKPEKRSASADLYHKVFEVPKMLKLEIPKKNQITIKLSDSYVKFKNSADTNESTLINSLQHEDIFSDSNTAERRVDEHQKVSQMTDIPNLEVSEKKLKTLEKDQNKISKLPESAHNNVASKPKSDCVDEYQKLWANMLKIRKKLLKKDKNTILKPKHNNSFLESYNNTERKLKKQSTCVDCHYKVLKISDMPELDVPKKLKSLEKDPITICKQPEPDVKFAKNSANISKVNKSKSLIQSQIKNVVPETTATKPRLDCVDDYQYLWTKMVKVTKKETELLEKDKTAKLNTTLTNFTQNKNPFLESYSNMESNLEKQSTCVDQYGKELKMPDKPNLEVSKKFKTSDKVQNTISKQPESANNSADLTKLNTSNLEKRSTCVDQYVKELKMSDKPNLEVSKKFKTSDKVQNSISKQPKSANNSANLTKLNTSNLEKRSTCVDQYGKELKMSDKPNLEVSKKFKTSDKVQKTISKQPESANNSADLTKLNTSNLEKRSTCVDQYDKELKMSDKPNLDVSKKSDKVQNTISKQPESANNCADLTKLNTSNLEKRSTCVDQYDKELKMSDKPNLEVTKKFKTSDKVQNTISKQPESANISADLTKLNTSESAIQHKNTFPESTSHSSITSKPEKRTDFVEQYQNELKLPDTPNLEIPKKLKTSEKVQNTISKQPESDRKFANDSADIRNLNTNKSLIQSISINLEQTKNVASESIAYSNEASKQSDCVDQHQNLLTNTLEVTKKKSKLIKKDKKSISKPKHKNAFLLSYIKTDKKLRKRATCIDRYHKVPKLPDMPKLEFPKKLKTQKKNQNTISKQPESDRKFENDSADLRKLNTNESSIPINLISKENVVPENIAYNNVANKPKKQSDCVEQFQNISNMPEMLKLEEPKKKLKTQKEDQNAVLPEFDVKLVNNSANVTELKKKESVNQQKNTFPETTSHSIIATKPTKQSECVDQIVSKMPNTSKLEEPKKKLKTAEKDPNTISKLLKSDVKLANNSANITELKTRESVIQDKNNFPEITSHSIIATKPKKQTNYVDQYKNVSKSTDILEAPQMKTKLLDQNAIIKQSDTLPKLNLIESLTQSTSLLQQEIASQSWNYLKHITESNLEQRPTCVDQNYRVPHMLKYVPKKLNTSKIDQNTALKLPESATSSADLTKLNTRESVIQHKNTFPETTSHSIIVNKPLTDYVDQCKNVSKSTDKLEALTIKTKSVSDTIPKLNLNESTNLIQQKIALPENTSTNVPNTTKSSNLLNQSSSTTQNIFGATTDNNKNQRNMADKLEAPKMKTKSVSDTIPKLNLNESTILIQQNIALPENTSTNVPNTTKSSNLLNQSSSTTQNIFGATTDNNKYQRNMADKLEAPKMKTKSVSDTIPKLNLNESTNLIQQKIALPETTAQSSISLKPIKRLSCLEQYQKIVELLNTTKPEKVPEKKIQKDQNTMLKFQPEKRSNDTNQKASKTTDLPKPKVPEQKIDQNTKLKLPKSKRITNNNVDIPTLINLVQQQQNYRNIANRPDQHQKVSKTTKPMEQNTVLKLRESNAKCTNNDADISKLNTNEFLNLIHQPTLITLIQQHCNNMADFEKQSDYINQQKVSKKLLEPKVQEQKIDQNTVLKLPESNVIFTNNNADIAKLNTNESLNSIHHPTPINLIQQNYRPENQSSCADQHQKVSKEIKKPKVSEQKIDQTTILSKPKAKFTNNTTEFLKSIHQPTSINLIQQNYRPEKQSSYADQHQKVSKELPKPKVSEQKIDQTSILPEPHAKFTNNTVEFLNSIQQNRPLKRSNYIDPHQKAPEKKIKLQKIDQNTTKSSNLLNQSSSTTQNIFSATTDNNTNQRNIAETGILNQIQILPNIPKPHFNIESKQPKTIPNSTVVSTPNATTSKFKEVPNKAITSNANITISAGPPPVIGNSTITTNAQINELQPQLNATNSIQLTSCIYNVNMGQFMFGFLPVFIDYFVQSKYLAPVYEQLENNKLIDICTNRLISIANHIVSFICKSNVIDFDINVLIDVLSNKLSQYQDAILLTFMEIFSKVSPASHHIHRFALDFYYNIKFLCGYLKHPYRDLYLKAFPPVITPAVHVESPRTLVESPRTIVESSRILVELPRTLVELPRTLEESPRTLEESPRTSVELPRILVESPRTLVESSRTLVELPRTLEELPRTLVEFPKTSVELPRTLVELPKILVESPRTSVELPKTLVELPRPLFRQEQINALDFQINNLNNQHPLPSTSTNPNMNQNQRMENDNLQTASGNSDFQAQNDRNYNLRYCICGIIAIIECECKATSYCSRKCLIDDWPNHKKICRRRQRQQL